MLLNGNTPPKKGTFDAKETTGMQPADVGLLISYFKFKPMILAKMLADALTADRSTIATLGAERQVKAQKRSFLR